MIKYKIVTILIFIFSITGIRAQGNLAYFDDQIFHFGFSLGWSTMDFCITPSNQLIDGKVYKMDVSELSPGFSVGIIGDLRLGRYFNLRSNPTLNLNDRNISFIDQNDIPTTPVNIKSIPVCLPVLLKYSAERYKNFRPYLLGGAGAYVDLGRDAGAKSKILLKPFDIYFEVGVGCDIYFSFFKLAPELKFALGTQNMLTPVLERTEPPYETFYSDAISGLTSKMITLSFNFE